MHDVRVALYLHKARELHGADLAHPPEVVAPEVNEHYVLGPFFLVGEELFGQKGVLLRRRAPRPRARYGTGHHAPALGAHQRLGRSSDEGQIS